MTRRIRPPIHPKTGDPIKDNAYRIAWKEYKKFLDRAGLFMAHMAIHQGVSPDPVSTRKIPRKTKKAWREIIYRSAFTYEKPSPMNKTVQKGER